MLRLGGKKNRSFLAINWNAPGVAWPPAFFRQVRHAAAVESILSGLSQAVIDGAVRDGDVSARTIGLDEGRALLALGFGFREWDRCTGDRDGEASRGDQTS
jgi:hypothetical protein